MRYAPTMSPLLLMPRAVVRVPPGKSMEVKVNCARTGHATPTRKKAQEEQSFHGVSLSPAFLETAELLQICFFAGRAAKFSLTLAHVPPVKTARWRLPSGGYYLFANGRLKGG